MNEECVMKIYRSAVIGMYEHCDDTDSAEFKKYYHRSLSCEERLITKGMTYAEIIDVRNTIITEEVKRQIEETKRQLGF